MQNCTDNFIPNSGMQKLCSIVVPKFSIFVMSIDLYFPRHRMRQARLCYGDVSVSKEKVSIIPYRRQELDPIHI